MTRAGPQQFARHIVPDHDLAADCACVRVSE